MTTCYYLVCNMQSLPLEKKNILKNAGKAFIRQTSDTKDLDYVNFIKCETGASIL